MFEELTVKETVRFTRRLKGDLPQHTTKETEKIMEDSIDMLLEDFALGHVKDNIVGGHKTRGISGGQKRRVTLARGLVTNPMISFLDEPTSGLSATDAEIAIRVLRFL